MAADKADGSGPLLGWLLARNITPFIPVIDRGRQRDAFFTRDAFRYDREADAYRCSADKPLALCGTNRTKQVRVYRSRPADCAACALKPQCTIGPKRKVTREALAIGVDQGIKDEQVVAAMTRISSIRGAPRTIRVNNGPELISKALDRWAHENGVTLNFSRPGNPTDNAFVEPFNGRLWDECLNMHWFLSLEDARAKIEAGRRDYNESRPHTSLGWLTPVGYAAAAAKIAAE